MPLSLLIVSNQSYQLQNLISTMQLGSTLLQWIQSHAGLRVDNVFTWQYQKTDVPKGETQTDWRERSEVSTRQDGRNRKLRRTKKKKKRKAEARRKAGNTCLHSLHHQDFGVH